MAGVAPQGPPDPPPPPQPQPHPDPSDNPFWPNSIITNWGRSGGPGNTAGDGGGGGGFWFHPSSGSAGRGFLSLFIWFNPAKTGTKQPPDINWSKIGSCLVSSAANHYGLTGATAASGVLALPIPKAWVPPYKVIGTPTTNLLSILGRYVDISIPSITIAGRTSGNLLRVAGRANPYVFAGLLAIDAGVIGYNTYNCYQQSDSSGGQKAKNGSGVPQ
jgi:hypothetical protein